jgi:hypothetical protein
MYHVIFGGKDSVASDGTRQTVRVARRPQQQYVVQTVRDCMKGRASTPLYRACNFCGRVHVVHSMTIKEVKKREIKLYVHNSKLDRYGL